MVDPTPELFLRLSLLGLALLAGFAMGALYFALLWRSVRAMSRTKDPWRTLAGGAVLRLVMLTSALAALLALGVDAWLIIPGAAGFLLARLAATALARAPLGPASGEG